MADIVALRATLTCLGLFAKVAGFVTDDQGLDTLDALKVLTKDEIESLCKVVWRPGGTVPNPNSGDPGQPYSLCLCFACLITAHCDNQYHKTLWLTLLHFARL